MSRPTPNTLHVPHLCSPRLRPSSRLCAARPRGLALRLGLALALLSSGCATPGSEPAGALLRVATGDSGRGLAPHRELIERFKAATPGVEVRLEAVSGGDYYTRLLTQQAAGAAADILHLGDDAVPSFVRRGALRPLDGAMQGSSPLDPAGYLTGVLEPGRWRGRQYLLPKDFTPVAVFCNASIFRRAGQPLPQASWTWADLRATARALTRDADGDGRIDTFGVVLPGPVAAHLELWAAGAGGSPVDAHGAYAGALDGPACLEAARYVRALIVEDGSAPLPQELGTWEGGNHQFEQGRAAMWVTGRWPQPGLVSKLGRDLVVLPPPRYRQPSNILFWAGFGVGSQCRQPELAWRFLRNHAGPGASEVWRAWALPASVDLVRREHLDEHPLDGVWIRSIAAARPRAFTVDPFWNRLGEPAARALMETAVLLPHEDLEATAHRLARQAESERERAAREEATLP